MTKRKHDLRRELHYSKLISFLLLYNHMYQDIGRLNTRGLFKTAHVNSLQQKTVKTSQTAVLAKARDVINNLTL